MVNGLILFRDWMNGFEDCYTLIGGAACDLWMGEQGLEFRSTNDLDIVLVFETKRPDFVRKLWDFVKAGAYRGYQAGETPENYYRFHKPRIGGFPKKLEICTKRPLGVPADVTVLRLPAGEGVSSLSAILLDPDYFALVRSQNQLIQGVRVATAACLMPLKSKAWLNLSERKAAGGRVDQKDIDKHRADVFRLLLTVTPDSKISLSPAIQADLRRFIDQLPLNSEAWERIRASLRSNNLTLPSPTEATTAFRAFHGLD